MEADQLNKVLSNLCTNRADIFGNGAIYQTFERDQIRESLDGFSSVQIYGRVIYKDKLDRILKSDPIVIKRMVKIWYKNISVQFCFLNEMNFYTKVAPALSTIDSSFSSLIPKFFYGETIFNAGGDQSTIILEDLKHRGYRMSEKKSFLNYQHLVLMMRKLGQFHAYSYKAKTSIPDLFYPLASNYLETFYEVNRESFIKWTECRRGLQHLQKDANYVKYVPRINEMMNNAHDIFVKTLTGDRTNPLSVIVHGDYLRNNIMFKYDNDTPSDLIFIDMANFRYGSPVIDLATLLYVSADQKTRDEHWDSLIDEYCATLKGTFPENEVLSRDEIMLEFSDKCVFVYFIAVSLLPMLIAFDNNDAVDFSVEGETIESIELLIPFFEGLGGNPATEALSDILKDMINRGFIPEDEKLSVISPHRL